MSEVIATEVVGTLTRFNGRSIWILKDDGFEAEMSHEIEQNEEISLAIRLAVMPAALTLVGKRVSYFYAPGSIVIREINMAEPAVWLKLVDGRVCGRSLGTVITQ